MLPLEGKALLTVADKDKPQLLHIAQRLKELGFEIYATEGTARFLNEKGISTTAIKKLHEGRPNIADAIQNRELNLIINTPIGRGSKYDDSYIYVIFRVEDRYVRMATGRYEAPVPEA